MARRLSPTTRSRLLGGTVAAALWAPTTLLFAVGEPQDSAIDLILAGFPVSAGVGALLAPQASRTRGFAYRVAAEFAVLAVLVGSLVFALPYALFHAEGHSFLGALAGYALLGLLVMGIPVLILGFNLALLWTAIVRGVARRLPAPPLFALVIVAAFCLAGCAPVTTIWVENRSPQAHLFFVDNLSDHEASWYIVPPNTTGRAGSSMGQAVRVNVLGWRHQEGYVGQCAPGDYDDTLFDPPPEASVRLLIEEDGRPSVAFASAPPGSPRLPEASIQPLNNDELCAWFAQRAPFATREVSSIAHPRSHRRRR